MKIALSAFLILILFLTSCNKNIVVKDSINPDLGIIKNRIFFVIHGDGSYLFHYQNGNSLDADREALKKAIYTAQNLPNSEIFIFHIKKKRNFLLFFPLKDRDFYFYRNGKLIDKESYFSKRNLLSDNTEAVKLKSEINNSYPDIHNFLFYYGHEIPQTDMTGYHSSYPDRRFNIDSLSVLIKKLAVIINSQFDLITISTCNNGNPYSLYKTLPFSKFVVACPGDLHLSYIDCRSLIKPLNNYMNLEDAANMFTQAAFDSLSLHTNTTVVLSLYKSSLILPELNRIFTGSNYILDSKNNDEYVDCFEHNAGFPNSQIKEGTKVFYKPPLFGKNKNVKSHSGWGCTTGFTFK